MRYPQAQLLGLTALITLAATPAFATVTYSLRDARFFGETTQRETTESGTLAPASAESLPVNFSTGGPTPTTFSALSTNQLTPFRLTASNQVSAGADTALTFNSGPPDPTTFVSLVQSQVQDSNVVVTGGSGTGYLLPTFRVKGAFSDTHASAFAAISVCAGVNSCTPTNVANSTGPANVDTTFTPTIGTTTDFTFDTPFTFFFFLSAGIFSFTNGNLAVGELGVDFSELELLSIAVVDATGDPIPGAVITSEFLDWLAGGGTTPVPEPSTLALLGLGICALLARRRV